MKYSSARIVIREDESAGFHRAMFLTEFLTDTHLSEGFARYTKVAALRGNDRSRQRMNSYRIDCGTKELIDLQGER